MRHINTRICSRFIVMVSYAAIIAMTIALTACEERKVFDTTTDMRIEPPRQMRILLVSNATSSSINPQQAFTVIDARSDRKAMFSKQAVPFSVSVKNGSIAIGKHTFGKTVYIEPDSPFIINLNSTPYRGRMTITTDLRGESFDIVNTLPIEAYLAGVIAAEMPSYWEPQALKAQAVASRTYCLFIKQKFGPKRHWDLKATQASQVYKGVNAETATVKQALKETTGMVLTCTQNHGRDIFPTYFSSTCGGRTENSKHVFGDDYVSLTSVKCRYCRTVAQSSLLNWSSPHYTIDGVSRLIMRKYPHLQKLRKIKTVTPIYTSPQKPPQRITSVKLKGTNDREATMRAENFRLTVDPTGAAIKSTCSTLITTGDKIQFINGKGYGHGVGLCQYGAEAMARQGKNFRQILKFYYTNSTITKKY
ncbi:MAG: SpoIID/LytB domain-containing protein [Anaerohalosphaera sp.]|nr:SpoIID/LytB domain-containing protein [Anaerohalosphaera sp.]